MNLLHDIENYIPVNQQEERDKEQMIRYMMSTPNYLNRENLIAHFTASMWTVNRERTKTLMVYHNLYDSWSWTGGHADGMEDLCAVAMKELQEETGVRNAVTVSRDIFSLETLTVNGHVKKGIWVPGHVHFNVTYLGNAYEIPSPNSAVLMRLLRETCEKHGSKADKCFEYLHAFEERDTYEQLSLF